MFKMKCKHCGNEDQSMLEVEKHHPIFDYILCNVCSKVTTIEKIQTPLEALGTTIKSDS
jgi:hypothetical protein